MSNFNFTSFTGYEHSITAGPEVVNGTGHVSLCFRSGTEDEQVYFLMAYPEVLRLAEWLADQAFEAQRHQWREHHTLSG